jgi:hypothetical protein
MAGKRKKGVMFDKFALAHAGASVGVVETEDGDALDLSEMPGVRRLFISFALDGDSKLAVTKTRDGVTKTTVLKDDATLKAGRGYGPIAVPVSALDTFDVITLSDVGFDWILIEASYKAEE